MGVLDSFNGRWGRGTMRLASVPIDPNWGISREMVSQSFTICGQATRQRSDSV
ncbi:hypothetical protein DOZ80_25145 [Pseudomonas fluorescens]|uniref:DUF4113 domain-containing protein n=1 Tax=Pseudomonas fluorescens TaxID=294 RepID=A0A327MPE0_PSEFL|nr:hypothetical protein DOZ80_25145 [Pseudomonas fluorescens]